MTRAALFPIRRLPALTQDCDGPAGGNVNALCFAYVSGLELEYPQRTCGAFPKAVLMRTVRTPRFKEATFPSLLRSLVSECGPYLAACLPVNPRLSQDERQGGQGKKASLQFI